MLVVTSVNVQKYTLKVGQLHHLVYIVIFKWICKAYCEMVSR